MWRRYGWEMEAPAVMKSCIQRLGCGKVVKGGWGWLVDTRGRGRRGWIQAAQGVVEHSEGGGLQRCNSDREKCVEEGWGRRVLGEGLVQTYGR